MSKEALKDKRRKGAWIWWVVFPPYALYLFFRYSPLRWYIKVPVILIITLAIVVSVDLAVSPNRVEIAQAKKAITSYVGTELDEETVVAIKRIGQGTSVTKEDVQLAVYYRVVTENSLYHMGLVAKDDNQLMVHHVEQLFPIRQDIQNFKNRTKAEVAIWLKDNEEQVGKGVSLISEDTSKNVQRVTTEKGTHEFWYTTQTLYQVKHIEDEKVLHESGQEPVLPQEVIDYLLENEERVGSLTRVLAYELDSGVERYYFLTSNGSFTSEIHPDGHIDINKRNEGVS